MSKARNLSQVIVDAGGDINASSLDNVTPASISDKANTSTGAFDLPAGTTAQRPASPHNGQTRFNTTLGYPEWYSANASAWVPYSEGLPYSIEYLIVAGGGGGGTGTGGGGGAGGYITGSTQVSTGASITATVGAGAPTAFYQSPSSNGSDSSFGLTLTAIGGGRGASGNSGTVNNGGNGGSGGGGAYYSGSTQTAGSGTAGQGYNGGAPGSDGGAGGGGANAVGGNGPSGAGGAGKADTWTGSTRYLGGGGGGSGGVSGGAGGVGGGGAGNPNNSSDGFPGAVNTGGGGGANWNYTIGRSGGAGGSGIVIIRYLGAQRGSGGTVTSSGGYTIHTFTSSGTYTA